MRLWSGASSALPFLVAPMGASAVLLFGVPASPLAQPWSIIGGNLVSATVGVACAQWIADPAISAAWAVSIAIAVMFALRCVHPPSGAVALTAVLGGPSIHALGFGFVLAPIGVQSVVLLGAALAYHALTGHRYPHVARDHAAGDKAPPVAESFTRADLEAVLKRRDELLDVDPDDLEEVLRETQMQAYARSFSELTCADVMSRSVISISPSTTARDALALLKRHGIKALPVTDTTRHVIGIVTLGDLANLRPKMARRLLARFTGRSHSGAGVIGRYLAESGETMISALMSTHVHTAVQSTPIVELVPAFARDGHHHIPIVDAAGRLTGIVTQADLIAGLYRQSQNQLVHAA